MGDKNPLATIGKSLAYTRYADKAKNMSHRPLRGLTRVASLSGQLG